MLSPKTNLARKKKCHESKKCFGIMSIPNNVPLLSSWGMKERIFDQ